MTVWVWLEGPPNPASWLERWQALHFRSPLYLSGIFTLQSNIKHSSLKAILHSSTLHWVHILFDLMSVLDIDVSFFPASETFRCFRWLSLIASLTVSFEMVVLGWVILGKPTFLQITTRQRSCRAQFLDEVIFFSFNQFYPFLCWPTEIQNALCNQQDQGIWLTQLDLCRFLLYAPIISITHSHTEFPEDQTYRSDTSPPGPAINSSEQLITDHSPNKCSLPPCHLFAGCWPLRSSVAGEPSLIWARRDYWGTLCIEQECFY